MGAVLSHVIILTVTFGHLSLDRSKQFLYTSTEGCTNDTFHSGHLKSFNTSALMILSRQETSELTSDYIQITEAAASDSDYSTFPQNIFAVTYMYYSLFGTLITVLFGILVSIFTQCSADRYDSKLIHPLALSAAKWFSGYENLFTDESEKPLETYSSYSSTMDQQERKKSIEPNINLAFDKSSD